MDCANEKEQRFSFFWETFLKNCRRKKGGEQSRRHFKTETFQLRKEWKNLVMFREKFAEMEGLKR